MSPNQLLPLAVRAIEALFALVVFGLSITLIHDHHWGSLPTILRLAAFNGGITFLCAGLGLVAGLFSVSFLEGVALVIVDGIVVLANVAVGCLMAMKMNGVKCTLEWSDKNSLKLWHNNLFNGGCMSGEICWVGSVSDPENFILGHCKQAQADIVFMFLTAAVFCASAAFVYLRVKK